MRVRYNFLIVLLFFVTVIMTVSSVSVYVSFKHNLLEGIDSSISNWGEALYDRVALAPYQLLRSSHSFILHPRSREYPANSIVVLLFNAQGEVIASSSDLPVKMFIPLLGRDALFGEVKVSKNKVFRTYQISVDHRSRSLGYIMTAAPISAYYKIIERVGIMLVLVTVCTIMVLGFGIYSLTFVNIVSNQKKFLGFASHELRIPLSVIIGNVDLLLRDKKGVPKRMSAPLEQIKLKCEWMNRLVGNLLLLFRTESFTEKIHKTFFDLNDLLVEECAQVQARFPQKKISIRIIPRSTKICADKDHLRKLFSNILDNAAKYTDARGRVRVELTTDLNGFLISITDNGLGIRKGLVRKIFEPYYRVNPRGKDGVGLGLAICKWIVESHKGSIKVESRPGQGTTFLISLPHGLPQTSSGS